MGISYHVTNFLESKTPLLEGEVFKTIPRTPYYEVSNYGRVKHKVYGNFITPYLVENDLKNIEVRVKTTNVKGEQVDISLGHEIIKLFNHPHKAYLYKTGHRITFLDKNPYNCCFDNLAIVRLDGKPLVPKKPKLRFAYWSHPDRVRAIKYDISRGYSDAEIARKHKMSATAIWYIRNGKRRGNIK
jgi:hypothetical protein